MFSATGLPVIAPPWTTLTAYDLNRGIIQWQMPLGEVPELAAKGVKYDELWMRAAGDQRGDDVVKAELFDAHVRHRFLVRVVLDDRDRVVAVWRRLGLTCWQVDYGDF